MTHYSHYDMGTPHLLLLRYNPALLMSPVGIVNIKLVLSTDMHDF